MNSKKRKIISLSAYSALILCLFTLSKNSFGWFENKVSLKEDLTGKSADAYFAYGNGTKENAFGIKTPRQLYNLAWLQYMGKLQDKEYYFEIADDINMEGWTLPPIGTTKYPFMGHITGIPEKNNEEKKTYQISNLTIANTSEKMTKVPYSVKNSEEYKKNDELSNIDIVGIFGCVGSIKSYYSDSTDVTQKDTETATIHDMKFSSIDITSQTSATLAGVVAGYLNSKVENIQIVVNSGSDTKIEIPSSTKVLNTITDNESISNYTSVGYCEEEYRENTYTQNQTLYAPETKEGQAFTAGGDDTNWGGSLDMESFYKRVKALQSYSNYNTDYSLARKIVLDENGNLKSSSYDTTSYTKLVGGLYHYNSSEYKSSYDPKIGALNLHNNGNDAFGLNGGSYVTSITTTDSYSIADDDGHYLSLDSTGNVTYTSSQSTAWILPESAADTIHATVNDVVYYLYEDSGTIKATTDKSLATTWNKKTGTSGTLISHGPEYLYFDTVTFSWKLREVSVTPFKIKFDNYYLCRNDSTDSSTYSKEVYFFKWSSSGSEETSDNALVFYVDSSTTISSNTCYSLYTLINNEKWYLECTGASNTGSKNKQYYLTKNPDSTASKNFFQFTQSGLKLASEAIYLRRVTNDWGWCYGNSSESASIRAVVDGNEVYFNNSSLIPSIDSKFYLTLTNVGASSSTYTKGKWYYDFEDVTYLPLNVYSSDDTSGNKQYEATDKNTGYLIGGSEENTSPSSQLYSNVRITNYGDKTTYLAGSTYYKGGSYTNVVTNKKTPYTVVKDSSGNFSVQNLNASDYVKYNDSVTTFRTSLGNSDGLYGFHFLSGSISEDKIIKAKEAYILGNVYDNYQMPANSVDFNLKNKGYINFFSGTYTESNSGFIDNSFFSIHEVIRDAKNEISEIREISKIYQANDKSSNAYLFEYYTSDSSKRLFSAKFSYRSGNRQYSNNQSKSTLVSLSSSEASNYLSNYDEIFDMQQLGNHNSAVRSTINNYVKNIFYFEIPVNDGEYCLGSVDGGNGAYLLYLDIGTNAATISRTTILEKYIQSTFSFSYPTGIVYYCDSKEKTIAIKLESTYSGTVEITSDDGKSLSLKNNSSIEVDLTYLDIGTDSLEVKATNMNVTQGEEESTLEVTRITYIDYNTKDGSLSKIIITKKGDDLSGEYYLYDETTSSWGDDLGIGNATIYTYNETSASWTTTTYDKVDVSYDPSTSILTFYFQVEKGVDGTVETIEVTYNLNTKELENTDTSSSDRYFADNGYEITFTLADGTAITITVTKKTDGSYFVSVTPEGSVSYTQP